MKTYLTMDIRTRGSAFITVMILIFTMSAFLGIIAVASNQRGYMASKLGDRMRAHSIAEAGVNYAYSVIKTNWAARTNGLFFPFGSNYASGSFTVDVTIASATSITATIISVGRYGIADATAELEIKNTGTGTLGWDTNAFNYAVLCGGTFDFAGCGTIASTQATAKVHANGKITISGSANVGGDTGRLDLESATEIEVKNNKTVNGDAVAPNIELNTSGIISGTSSEQAVPTIAIPQINLDPYYNWALAHGEVKAAGWTPPSNPYTPNGGIIWIDGSSGTINGGTINGAVIATGNVKLSGTVNVRGTSDSGGFAVVSRDGSVDNQSSGTIEGIVYVKTGNFTQTANGTLIGSLVVAGTISKGGNSDVIVYDHEVPSLPGGETATGDIIGVSAWKQ